MMVFRIDDNTLQEAIETRFQCARCGHCCKGDGVVRFGPAEAGRLADKLGLTRHQFLKTYALRLGAKEWVLRDKMVPMPGAPGGVEQWCIFLERDHEGLYLCSVNEAKPRQCHDFPAKWVNNDSLETCAGLRILAAQLRREANAGACEGNAADSPPA